MKNHFDLYFSPAMLFYGGLIIAGMILLYAWIIREHRKLTGKDKTKRQARLYREQDEKIIMN